MPLIVDASVALKWVLQEPDSLFAEALLNPREPNARLKATARRYLRLLGS